MKAKKLLYNIASVVVLVVTAWVCIWVYISVKATSDFQHIFTLGEDDGLRILLPTIIAEYTILASIRYFLFSQDKELRKTKVARTDMICGFLLLVSVWLQPMAFLLRNFVCFLRPYLYFVGGFVLCEPLQGVVMLLLAIRRIINTKRERREKPEEAASTWRRAVSNVINAIVLAVAIVAFIQCMMVSIAASFMGLLNLVGLH